MDLKSRLIELEGSKQYQATKGYFRSNKFWTYRDSLNKDTIGYGHLLKPRESFPNGISEEQANTLLDNDIEIAKHGLLAIGFDVPDDWHDFLIIMIFQLGINGTLKFRNMLEALKNKNYYEAINQVRNSLWYKQTPNRIEIMIASLKNK